MGFDLDGAIRKIPDFPKPGILFYDITSILTNPEAFSFCINSMVDIYRESEVNAIAAIESRGFLFAAPLAEKLSLPLVLVRKKGKLPGETLSKSFALEYGEDTIEIHKADVGPGQRFLIVDDLVATGGTLRAAVDLICEAGASVVEIFAPIGLPFLNYSAKLPDVPVRTLIEYDSE